MERVARASERGERGGETRLHRLKEQSLCSVLATRGLSTDLARGVSSCNLHIVALGVCRSAMTDVVLYVPARGLVACLLSSLREEGPLSGCVCGVSLDVVVSRDWELSCSVARISRILFAHPIHVYD